MQTHIIETTISIRQKDMPATLTLPMDSHWVHAGIVYVHGSGDGNEHEVILEANHFASNGIAFLMIAKVIDGYTKTKRDYHLLAEDTIAAVNWLRDRPELHLAQTGLMGFSEGDGLRR